MRSNMQSQPQPQPQQSSHTTTQGSRSILGTGIGSFLINSPSRRQPFIALRYIRCHAVKEEKRTAKKKSRV
ncbi:hypothetical protein AMATHDRAFT_58673, partial [Amanita thiersii Skay4041]